MKNLFISLAEIANFITLIQIGNNNHQLFVQLDRLYTKDISDIIHNKFNELEPTKELVIEEGLSENEYKNSPKFTPMTR